MRKFLPLISAILLLGFASFSAEASVGFDTQTLAGTGSGTSLTWNHTCTGANMVLIVVVITNQGSDPVTSVKYANIALTQVGVTTIDFGRTIALYSLAGPITGTNAVVVNTSTTTAIAASSQSFTGCNGQVNSPQYWDGGGSLVLRPTTNANNYVAGGTVCNNGYNSFGSTNVLFQNTSGIGWNTCDATPGSASFPFVEDTLAGAGLGIAVNISAGILPPKNSSLTLMGVG
jgi:hypothetical protein